MKIKLVIPVVCYPNLTRLQIQLVRKFFVEQVDIVLVLDSPAHLRSQFEALACELQVEYMPSPAKNETPSERHAIALEAAFSQMKNTGEYAWYGSIDSDLFPIQSLSIEEMAQGADVLGCDQFRGAINYLWPGLLIFKPGTLETASFRPCTVHGESLDSGGGLYHALQSKKPTVKHLYFLTSQWDRKQFDAKIGQTIRDIQLLCKSVEECSARHQRKFWLDVFGIDTPCFLHLRDISNWQHASPAFVAEKAKLFEQTMLKLLNSTS